jgi:hypothetical protein
LKFVGRRLIRFRAPVSDQQFSYKFISGRIFKNQIALDGQFPQDRILQAGADTRAAAGGAFVRDQFSCQGRVNVICSERINPIALKILSFYPLPNRDTRTNNRVDAANRINDSWRLDFRIDHRIGTKHHLFATYGQINQDQSSQGLTNIAYPREGVNGELATVQDRPRRAVISDKKTLDRWFDPTAFALAPAFSMGNNPRTEPNLRGPGTRNFDIGVYRNQRIKETIKLQIGADFQNAFNTPRLNDPITTIGDANFGRIIGGGNQRQIQIRVRLSY